MKRGAIRTMALVVALGFPLGMLAQTSAPAPAKKPAAKQTKKKHHKKKSHKKTEGSQSAPAPSTTPKAK